MKILLVSPVYPHVSSGKPLPSWQPQNYWRLALKSLGHNVKVFKLGSFPKSKLIRTAQLKAIINSFKPDEVFFSGGIDLIKPFENTVFFSGVPAKTLSEHERLIGLDSKLVVTNDPGQARKWEKLGAKKAIYLPISAIDTNFFKPKSTKKTIKVTFVGTLLPDRQLFLHRLIKHYQDINIYGYLPQSRILPELKPYYHGAVWGSQVKEIYQKSQIAINLVPGHLPSAGNLRTFEIPATKTLMLADQMNKELYQPGKETVIFKDPKDLAKKINYYLSHEKERDAIALAGYKRTIKEHTYKKRFEKLLKILK